MTWLGPHFIVYWAHLVSGEVEKLSKTHLAGSKLREFTIFRYLVICSKLISEGMILPKTYRLEEIPSPRARINNLFQFLVSSCVAL